MAVKVKQNVPTARSNRRFPVSSGKASPPIVVNAKALKPNPLNGNAVAVPRCCGQLVAQVLIAPENAEQLPMPVKRLAMHSIHTGNEPGPLL